MYGGVFLGVHFGIQAPGYGRHRDDEIPTGALFSAPVNIFPFLVPVRFYSTICFGTTPQRAGFADTITAILLFLLQDRIRGPPRRVLSLVRALESAGNA